MCQRPAPVRHSNQGNSSSATQTKSGPPARPTATRNSCLETAATWPIAGYRSMSESFVIFCASMATHMRSRNSSLQSSWVDGGAALHLVLAPEKEDPALGADMQRNNNFNYKEMDPHGYAVPLGSHMRRMNPRDTAANINRRRMIRRGATYGLPLPEGRSRRWRRPRHSSFHHLCKPYPTVRVRAKRLDKRPKLSRAR